MDNSVIIKSEISDEASHRKTMDTEPVSGNEPDENYETVHENTGIIFQHPLPIKTEPAWQINYLQLTDDQVPSHGMGTESSQSSVRQSLDVKTENPDGTIGQSFEVNTHDSDSEMYSKMQINIEPGSVRSLNIKFEVNVNDDEDKVQPDVLNCGDEINTEMADDSLKQFNLPSSSETESLDVKMEEHHAMYLASADNSVKREDEFMQTDYVVKQEPADAVDDGGFVSSQSWIDDENIDAVAANLEMRNMVRHLGGMPTHATIIVESQMKSNATEENHHDSYSTSSSNAASWSKAYRDRLKKDPIAWARHKEDEAVRSRERWANMTEEQKKKQREQARLRQRKLYAKRKLKQDKGGHAIIKKPKVTKVLTLTEKLKRREYNREKKRLSRAKRTPQKAAWDRGRDVLVKRKQRESEQNNRTKKKEMNTASSSKEGEGGHEIIKKPKVTKVLTLTEILKRREYNREKKRLSRAKRTPQKAAWDRERDVLVKRKQRESEQNKSMEKKEMNTASSSKEGGYKSDTARRMALSRIWSKLHNSVKRQDEMQTDCVVKQEPADADDNVGSVSSRSWMGEENIDAVAANLEMKMSKSVPLRIKLRSQSRQSVRNIQDNDITSTDPPSLLAGSSSNVRAKPSTLAMRRKRAQLKDDPVAWAVYKASEAERQRQRRTNRTEEQKQRDKEGGRARSAKYNKKKKELGEQHAQGEKNKLVMTREGKKMQWEYWKLKQRESRTKRDPSKKAWARKKDQKSQKLTTQKPTDENTNEDVPPLMLGYENHSAKRKALLRIKKLMPTNPYKYAEIVESLQSDSRLSLRKKAAIEHGGLHSQNKQKFELCLDVCMRLKAKLKDLQGKTDDESKDKRRTIFTAILSEKYKRQQNRIAKQFGTRSNYLSQLQNYNPVSIKGRSSLRKVREDETSPDTIASIADTYRSPAVSRELPLRRSVKKDLKPRHQMEVTVSRAYAIWKTNHPSVKLSLDVFRRFRPTDVLLLRLTRLNQCLCEICTDIMLKLQTFNHLANRGHKDAKLADKYELIAATLCPKDDQDKYFHPTCICRNCDDCGVKQLDGRFAGLLRDAGGQLVKWRKWSNKKYIHDGKEKSKKCIVTKTDTVESFLEELKDETKSLASHVFVAGWQHDMYRKITRDPPENTVIAVLDFAENYSCQSQDEVQSAHWTKNQVTIHPTVATYVCPDHGDHTVQEAIVVISNDLVHDGNAVQHFTKLAVAHLRDNQKVPMQRIIEFTDGCSGHYKSKLPFADISFCEDDLGLKLERHYFGSSHGKGPSDGVSGVVKAALRRAVLSCQANIDDARSVFQFCEENLTKTDCHSQKQKFIFVEAGSVNRDRNDREVKVAVPGTRLLHAVKGVEPGVIGCRLLSCFCRGCEEDGLCNNELYIMPWQTRILNLKVPVPPSQSSPTDTVEDEHGTGSGDTDGQDLANNMQDVPIQAIWNRLGGIERSDGGEDPVTGMNDLDISLNKSALEELDVEMLGYQTKSLQFISQESPTLENWWS